MTMSSRAARLAVAVLCAVTVGAVTAPASPAAQIHAVVVDPVPSTSTPDITDGTVYAIAKVGGKIIVGGAFTTATSPKATSSVTRNNILAFDAASGEIDPSFVPSINGEVKAIIPGPNNTVYVAGAFNSVNGVTQRLVRLDVGTGAITTGWKSQLNAQTSSVVLNNGVLYIAGAFTQVNGVAHVGLAALNPTSGRGLDWFNVNVSGRHGKGTAKGALGPKDIDVDPTGTKMVVIGNFTSASDAGGTLDRDQAMLVDLGPSTAAINRNWRSLRFTAQCASNAFDSWVRDVEIDPTGTYFVVASTGASGTNTDGSRALCDSAARFELAGTGTNVQPTWVSWTGRDSLWSVAVTDTAVYVGGHQRWLNNINGNDNAGAGAVARPGLAAIDPHTGVPLEWNPGRNPRGAGAFAILATDNGLYVGSDTAYIGDFKYRRERIAHFPLAGGSALPNDATGTLPGQVFMAGGYSTASTSAVLHRVNAAGSGVSSTDGGPAWASDNSWFGSPYHNFGSSTISYTSSIPADAAVPLSTPLSVFNSERYDGGSRGDGGEMKWTFSVAAGTPIAVRLYFAERYANAPGQRTFDVAIDGTTVLSAFDILGSVGKNRGTMREFPVTSDGTVNIDFAHVVGNPLVNAVEIVKVTSTTGSVDPTVLRSTHLDAALAVGSSGTVDSTTMDWSATRGAFLTSGYLYYGKTDATFNRRTFDGSTFGPEVKVDPYNDPLWSLVDTGSGQTYRGGVSALNGQLGSVTSMFYANHRIYYTLSGQTAMYSRGFVPSAGIIGDVATTVVDGFDWSQVAGAFVSGDSLFYALRTGALQKVAWIDGKATGTATTVDSTTNWATRSMFVVPDAVPVNLAPVASMTIACPTETLGCDLDASASVDPDGTIVRYDWAFGDGSSAPDAGPTVSHTYAAAGTYPVTLTVTDSGGSRATIALLAAPTAVGDPVPAGITFRASSQVPSASTATVTTAVPAEVKKDDLLVLFETVNSGSVTTTDPVGWQLAGSVKNANAMFTRIYVKKAVSGDAGTSVTMTYSATSKASAVMLAYAGVDPANPLAALLTATDDASSTHVTPSASISDAGSWVVSFWADKSPTTATSWSIPFGVTARSVFVGGGSGAVTQVVADSDGQVPTGSSGGKAATVNVASNKGATATLVLKAR